METPALNQPQRPNKIKNILIRYNSSKDSRTNSDYQHPDTSHLLKYFPKYHKSLTIDLPHQHSLISKIKRIKKLRRFTGVMKEYFAKMIWLNLLANVRKEIEEVPLITTGKPTISPKSLYWRQLSLQKAKYFVNITKVHVPRRKMDRIMDTVIDHEEFLKTGVRKTFVREIRNMRKLKEIEIFVKHDNCQEVKWFLGKLDQRMDLQKLENIKLMVQSKDLDLHELFENNHNLMSHLTGLEFSWKLGRFDPKLEIIPQMCKNLKYLSVGLDRFFTQSSAKFTQFLVSIQKLPKLESLKLACSKDMKLFWDLFKPQSSLKNLKLHLNFPLMIKEGLFGENIEERKLEKYEGLVSHWEDGLKNLEVVDLIFGCSNADEFILLRFFVTIILKKTLKLKSFRCAIYIPELKAIVGYEPFLVEEVAHLYESLERFEAMIISIGSKNCFNFDLKLLKDFKNLKAVKLHGNGLGYGNIEEAVDLLDKEKNRSLAVLELKGREVSDLDLEWVKETLKKLSKAKNMKILMELKEKRDFLQDGDIRFLESFCGMIKEARYIKGLEIHLQLFAQRERLSTKEEVKRVLSRYPELRNVVVLMGCFDGSVQFRRIDGEIEQLFIDK